MATVAQRVPWPWMLVIMEILVVGRPLVPEMPQGEMMVVLVERVGCWTLGGGIVLAIVEGTWVEMPLGGMGAGGGGVVVVVGRFMDYGDSMISAMNMLWMSVQ